MSDNWSQVITEVRAFRDYVSHLPQEAKDKAHFSYLLTKEEFHRLLALKGEDKLDGVRIYLGAQMVDGDLVPTIHVVPVEKHGGQYNDFGVPASAPPPAHNAIGATPLAFSATATTTSGTSSTSGSGGGTGNLPPCPAVCGGTNILNS